MKKPKTSAGAPKKYDFEKLKKGESELLVNEKGDVAIYSNKLQRKYLSAFSMWKKRNKSKVQLVTRKSKEIDDVSNKIYYSLRVIRVK